MIDIEIEAEAWTAALPDVAAAAERAAAAALGAVAGDVVVLLTDDEAVRALKNAILLQPGGAPRSIRRISALSLFTSDPVALSHKTGTVARPFTAGSALV